MQINNIMKQILVILFVVLTYSRMAISQNITIPEGVVYHKTTDKINKETKDIIRKCIDKKEAKILFDKAFICGPYLWEQLKKNRLTSNIQGIETNFHLQDTTLKGMVIQSSESLQIIWDFILNKKEEIKIREPNSTEIRQYWSLVAYELEEPIFIIESSHQKILLNLRDDNYKLLFIDTL